MMAIPAEIEESIKLAVEQERRRCVGILLRAFGEARQAGENAIADAIDRLALEIEKPNW